MENKYQSAKQLTQSVAKLYLTLSTLEKEGKKKVNNIRNYHLYFQQLLN